MPDNCERGSAVCVVPEVLDTEAISLRNLLAVSVPGGTNKTIDKNTTVQHSTAVAITMPKVEIQMNDAMSIYQLVIDDSNADRFTVLVGC